MKPIIIAIFLILLSAIAFLLLGGKDSASETVAVTRGEAVRAVYATGIVEPVEQAQLAPQKTGRLIAILRDEDDAVKAGDVVAQLDDHVERARLEEMNARLAFLEKDLARQRELVSRGAASRRGLEDVEREYGEIKARVGALREEIAHLTLTSPLEGIVLRRDVEPGETVQAGAVVFWVGKPSPLRITAEVDEEDIGMVKLGQVALIKADAFPDQVLEGTVSEITPRGDPVNKVFRVRIALTEDTPLLVSMTAEINVIIDTAQNTLLVPVTSISGNTAWRAGRRGKGEPVPVKTGIRGEKMIQVLEGLNEGDAILRYPPSSKER